MTQQQRQHSTKMNNKDNSKQQRKQSNLFNISTLSIDTRLEASRPAINDSFNHLIRHLVPRFLDGPLQRLHRLVGFFACDRLDLAPNRVVQRVQIRAVRRPLGDKIKKPTSKNVKSKISDNCDTPCICLLAIII